jgi:hypothetical protein
MIHRWHDFSSNRCIKMSLLWMNKLRTYCTGSGKHGLKGIYVCCHSRCPYTQYTPYNKACMMHIS